MLGDLVISIDEDGDRLRVDPVSRQQRAQHPEEETQQDHFHFQSFSCRSHLEKEADVTRVCVCADHQRSPVQVVGSVSCDHSYWNIDDVIDQQLQRKNTQS